MDATRTEKGATMRRVSFSLILLFCLPGAALADSEWMWTVHGGLAWGWQDDIASEFTINDSALLSGAGVRWSPDWSPSYLNFQAEAAASLDSGEWQGETLRMQYGALFTGLRLGDPLRLLLRGGVATTRVDVSGATGTDTGLAGSIGLGFPMDNHKLELHLTSIDRNISYVGLYWRF